MRERYDEAGLRQLLRDAELLAERVALCVAAGDPTPAARVRGVDVAASTAAGRSRWTTSSRCATASAPRCRRPGARPSCRRPTPRSTRRSRSYQWHRRLAGDARKKNAFLQFLYKGG